MLEEKTLLSFLSAQSLVLENSYRGASETVSLENSIGRILAEPLIADRAYPPFNRAAMDGFALHSGNFEKGKVYTIVKEIYAGQLTEVSLKENECVRIMTGAPVPASCDVVIRVEDSQSSSGGEVSPSSRGDVSFTQDSIKSWQHIARKGEDLQSGQIALNAGVLIRSGEAAIAASLGYAEIKVVRLPKVTLLTTGDEIIPVEQKPEVQQIRNSNAWTITALLRNFLITPQKRLHLHDEPDALESEFRNAKDESDILIVSGGVSAGKADHVPAALIKAGYTQVFHKVQIKPGKPIWFGKAENGKVVFALPGNPLSVQVCFKLFVDPWIRNYLGSSTNTSHKVICAQSRVKKNNLDEFVMAVYDKTKPGLVHLKPFNGSGDITSTANVDGLLRHAADAGDLKAGDVVDFIHL